MYLDTHLHYNSLLIIKGAYDMAIDKKKNTSLNLTIPIELKEKCKALAEVENRTTTNFIVNAVLTYIKTNYPEE